MRRFFLFAGLGWFSWVMVNLVFFDETIPGAGYVCGAVFPLRCVRVIDGGVMLVVHAICVASLLVAALIWRERTP